MALTVAISLTGCGGNTVAQADINPNTPIEEVTFPLAEKKELSFITNAPLGQNKTQIKELFL